MFENMSLHTLFKRAPPVWLHPTFLGEFGDSFLEGTGLEGGSIPAALQAFSLVVDRAIQEQKYRFNILFAPLTSLSAI